MAKKPEEYNKDLYTELVDKIDQAYANPNFEPTPIDDVVNEDVRLIRLLAFWSQTLFDSEQVFYQLIDGYNPSDPEHLAYRKAVEHYISRYWES